MTTKNRRRSFLWCAVLLSAAVAAAPLTAQCLPGDLPACAPFAFAGAHPVNTAGYSAAFGVSPCGTAADVNDAWWFYVPVVTGSATISVCPSSVAAPGPGVPGDNVLSVYADAGGAPGALIGCSDSSPECSVSEAEVCFPVVTGVQYYVQLSNWAPTSVMVGTLTIVEYSGTSCGPCAVPPANDDAAGATVVAPGPNGVFDTTCATDDTAASCGGLGKPVWFAFSPPPGAWFVSTCPADGGSATFDTVIVVRDLFLNELCCNDDACGLQSRCCVFDGMGPVYIQVGGWNGATGQFTLAITSCAPPAGPTATIPAKLSSWLPFQTVAGGTTGDCAFGPAASVFGASPCPGAVGSALSFDGAASYVEKASATQLNVPSAIFPPFNKKGDFSWEGWVRPHSYAGVVSLADKRDENYLGSGASRGWHVYLTGGRLGVQIANGAWIGGLTFSNYEAPGPAGVVPLDCCWHHVAVTVRRWSTTGVNLYIDGALVGTGNPMIRLGGSLTNSNPYRIGCRSSSFGGFFDGDIDEPSFYRRQLSAAEIAGIYAAGAAGKFMDVEVDVPPAVRVAPGAPTARAHVKLHNLLPHPATFRWTVENDAAATGATHAFGASAASPAGGALTLAAGEVYDLPLNLLRPAGLSGPTDVAAYVVRVEGAGVLRREGRGLLLGSAIAAELGEPVALPGAAGYVAALTLTAPTAAQLAYRVEVVALDGSGDASAVGLDGAADATPLFGVATLAAGTPTVVPIHFVVRDDDPCAGYALVAYDAAGLPLGSRVVRTLARSGDFDLRAGFDAAPAPNGLRVLLENGPPSAHYALLATFDRRAYPFGAFGGLDLTFGEVAAQIAAGSPFVGALDAEGRAEPSFPGVGPFGVPLYGVAYALDPTTGAVLAATPPLKLE